ncbi:hypothetical protein KR018_012672 [Drosophila ironensis]|nr:hypothetical protein KR018_012672 [Drosophila ironensis]
MDKNIKNVDLQLGHIDVLTSGTAAEFVNGILDFLLYQRQQIPFVYKTYKFIVEGWSDKEEAREQGSFKDYQLNQQRSKAKATKEAISDMREVMSWIPANIYIFTTRHSLQVIRQAFKTSQVKSLRFLFGHNTFMPSEAYTLHIPHASISRHHFGEHHALPEGRVNQALLRLLTCEELYALFSTDLVATNVFLELELLKEDQSSTGHWTPKEVLSQLPRSCKNVHLHLLHENKGNPTSLRCCKELDVYKDLGLTKLDESQEEGVKSQENTGWWQAEVIVRGFRAPANEKAHSLWSS